MYKKALNKAEPNLSSVLAGPPAASITGQPLPGRPVPHPAGPRLPPPLLWQEHRELQFRLQAGVNRELQRNWLDIQHSCLILTNENNSVEHWSLTTLS